MAEENLHEQIAHLEGRLEQLADGAEKCRKIAFFSKLVIAAGIAVLLVVLLGLVPFNPTVAVGAAAAVIGGVVLLGANASTLKQTIADIRAAEGLRSELIGRIELRAVEQVSAAGPGGVPATMNGQALN
jgi:hypothetical protein